MTSFSGYVFSYDHFINKVIQYLNNKKRAKLLHEPAKDPEKDKLIDELTNHLSNKILWGIDVSYNEETTKNHISEYKTSLPPFNGEKGCVFNCIEVKTCKPSIFLSVLNQLNTFFKAKESHQLLVLDIICNPTLFSNELKELLNAALQSTYFYSMQITQNQCKSIISDAENLNDLLLKLEFSETEKTASMNFQITFRPSSITHADNFQEKGNLKVGDILPGDYIFTR